MSRFQMHSHGVLVLLVWAASINLAPITFGQGFGQVLITKNPSFEDLNQVGTLQDWNYRDGLQATIVDRDPNRVKDDFEFAAGAKLVRLNGKGGFGQIVQVDPSAKNILFNVLGYAQTKTGGAATAIAQVTLYDDLWNELLVTPIVLGRKNPTNASGVVPHTYGIFAPPNTKFALMAIWSWDPNVDVYVDSFSLFDDTPPKPLAYAPRPNLIINPYPALSVPSAPTSGFHMWGEFWNTTIDYQSHPLGIALWGSPRKAESAYQFVPMQGQNAYRFNIANAFQTPEMGFDYYDANWNSLGKGVIQNIPNDGFSADFLVTPPAKTAHASLYLYVPQGKTAEPPFLGLHSLGALSSGSTFVADFVGYGGGPRSSGTSGWRVEASWVDTDGVDTSSVSTGFPGYSDDFYVTSRSNPSKTYPVYLRSLTDLPGGGIGPVFSTSVDGKLTRFAIHIYDVNPSDFGKLILKPNAIKDLKGNFIPSRSFDVPPPR